MDVEQAFDLDPAISYLNHAAVSPWPRCTREAVCRFAEENARQGSAGYPQWLQTEQALREQMARLVRAASSDEIALLKSTSEGLSVVAHGLDWRPGDNLVVGQQEFPSNRIVWESLQRYGVEVRYADLSVEDPEAALLQRIDSRTRLLSVSSVQYASGLRHDLPRLGDACARQGVLFCIDAIQSLGALPFDAQACHADFVVADGHKWLLGPEGLALFWCRAEHIERLQLHQYGWHMVEQAGDFDRLDWQPAASARRFECGSPNMLGIHALHASLGLLETVGLQQVAAELAARSLHLIEWLQGHADRYALLTPSDPARRAGIVTFRPLRETAEVVYGRLREAGVQCALRGGGVRLSPHFYTPWAALDRALACL
ncbi:aminotransferase class V-fold PLP-dependent enzyme [Thiohalobacter sp. IOR34]|uniref:aminotransferase class V-fold PLP-dependent enzyme n=1 Tax=Thiohalobacter sp. IOR34 TaxID=3057176 RepID=UPI0025B20662|nr:aminotransferase class V-fold PLP-dependent enzyme [Thiohalobacter sp. IOR34]WJW74264.1 aminotransferase class V-fold PLP-dependent enzyme [Thiohalobacter sp. IOR34]